MIRLLLALFLLAVPCAAQAENFNVSYSDWLVQDKSVRLTAELPAAEARQAIRDLPLTPEAVAHYVGSHVGAHSAGGDCRPIDQGFDIGTVDPLTMQGGRFRFEIFFACPNDAGIVLSNAMMFALAPAHLDFARVTVDGRTISTVLTAGRQTIAVSPALRSDGFAAFLPVGVAHVRHNWDHIVFLIGLLIVLRGRKELWLAMAGLASGYALSALFAFNGQLVPDAAAAEALSGLAILLLAIEAVTKATRSRTIPFFGFAALAVIALVPLLQSEWRTAIMLQGAGLLAASYGAFCATRPTVPSLRLIPTALFGLLDGLSFLPPLAPLQRGFTDRAAILAGFDCGAFAAQAVTLVLLFLLANMLRFKRLEIAGPWLRDLGTAALSGIGLFWLARDFLL